MTQQEAYVKLSNICTQIDALTKEGHQLAKDNDLVFAQRFLDSGQEVLDPARYTVTEETYQKYDWRTKTSAPATRKVMTFLDTDDEYPGEPAWNWLPSKMC